MKTFVLSAVTSLLLNEVHGQTSNLPLYHPDFNLMQQMLQNKSNMYEGGFQSVSDAYNSLINLRLTNKENIKILNLYRDNVIKQVQKWNTVDFSIPSNVDKAVRFINQYYTDNQYIRDEMALIYKIMTEIDTLKERYPANYMSTERFKELLGIITGYDLENCSPDQINGLGLKHGIL